MSVIPADNNFMVFAAVALLAWLGFAMEKTKYGKITTGIVWTGGLAILLSNIGVLPEKAQAYNFVKSYLVPLAIPLLLMKVNLQEIFAETGKTLIAFVIGAITTVIGTIVGVWMFDLGILEKELAGIFAATYIGGTLNFAASSEALSVKDDVLLSAALAADSLAGKAYLMILAILPTLAFMQRWFKTEEDGTAVSPVVDTEKSTETAVPDVLSISGALALAITICAAGYTVAHLLNLTSYGILFVTAFSLIPGTFFKNTTGKLHGAYDMGMICAFLFFAAVGAGANISTLVGVAPAVMGLAVIIVVIHAVILFPVARLAKLSLAETITASNACILGPTTAAALAAARGWPHLVTPGLLAGLFGYATGTFIGVFLYQLL